MAGRAVAPLPPLSRPLLLVLEGLLCVLVDLESSRVVKVGLVEKLPCNLGGLHDLEDERVEVIGETGL